MKKGADRMPGSESTTYGLLSLLFISAALLAVYSYFEQKGGFRNMKNSTIINASIPSIDLSAPAKTETATFALG